MIVCGVTVTRHDLWVCVRVVPLLVIGLTLAPIIAVAGAIDKRRKPS